MLCSHLLPSWRASGAWKGAWTFWMAEQGIAVGREMPKKGTKVVGAEAWGSAKPGKHFAAEELVFQERPGWTW